MEALISIVILVIIIAYLVLIYNNLVEYRNRGINNFSQIDVQLKRRYDLIPNLVETAKAYLQHERGTLEAVTAARNEASQLLQKLSGNPTDVQTMKQFNLAESSLGSALGNLRVSVEAHPDLKGSTNMIQLSEELTSTENKVSFARQAYNDSVNFYNTYRQSFPNVLIARTVGHGEDMAHLEFAEKEALQQAPRVSF